jgi:hypothetical protein
MTDLPRIGRWHNDHCDRCGKKSPWPLAGSIALIPDGWRLFGGPVPGEPWGPVRPGITLPYRAERRNRQGYRYRCEQPASHDGRHLGGGRYFNAETEQVGEIGKR